MYAAKIKTPLLMYTNHYGWVPLACETDAVCIGHIWYFFLQLKQRYYRILVVVLRRPKLAFTLTSNPNCNLVPAWIFHRKTNTWRCRSLLEKYEQSPQPKYLTNTLCTHSYKFGDQTVIFIAKASIKFLSTFSLSWKVHWTF